MTTSFRRETAKLYEFPTRARIMAGGHREEAKAAADMRAQQVCEVSFGSGWYHEAALRDSERTSKP